MRDFLGPIIVYVVILAAVIVIVGASQHYDNGQSYRVEMIENGEVSKTWTTVGLVKPEDSGCGSARSYSFTDAATGQQVKVVGGNLVVTRIK
jgi:hypothetical protein